jgi:hypothetical protein
LQQYACFMTFRFSPETPILTLLSVYRDFNSMYIHNKRVQIVLICALLLWIQKM